LALILIVDDDKDVRETIAATLQLENHVTLEAPDGNAALQLIQAQDIDLIVTDIFMPQLGGGEMIKKVRGEYPNIKIIAISGSSSSRRHSTPHSGSHLENLDADAQLAKPFYRRDLLAAVESVLGRA
jgi:CheY-like chemotaxis protein